MDKNRTNRNVKRGSYCVGTGLNFTAGRPETGTLHFVCQIHAKVVNQYILM